MAAQNSLSQLCEQSGEQFESGQEVTEYLQQLLEREKQAETTDSGTHGASFLLSNYGRQH